MPSSGHGAPSSPFCPGPFFSNISIRKFNSPRPGFCSKGQSSARKGWPAKCTCLNIDSRSSPLPTGSALAADKKRVAVDLNSNSKRSAKSTQRWRTTPLCAQQNSIMAAAPTQEQKVRVENRCCKPRRLGAQQRFAVGELTAKKRLANCKTAWHASAEYPNL